MATVLDFGLIQAFDVVFPVIFTFALVFALLSKTKAVGSNVSINAIIAVAVSFMILLSRTVIDLINFIIPWFTVAIIFFVLLLLVFYTFGLRESNILEFVKTDKSVGWVIVGIGIVIILAGFGTVVGQKLTEQAFIGEDVVNGTDGGTATSDFSQNLMAILIHPKVLGLAILFAIAIFAVALLTG